MTFYVNDESHVLPNLPSLGFVLDESPNCQHSIKFWEEQTEEIGSVVNHVTSCAKAFHKAGMEFSAASSNFTTGLQKAANVLSKDVNLSKPLLKFADVLQRIDCYYDMFLSQTEMLMCTPLDNLAKEYEKVKEMKNQVKKAGHDMHMCWERFSSCQNITNLQEPSVLDKLAYNMLSSRQHYQRLQADYINSLREVNTVKKVSFVKTLVENILARFFFVNFTFQILKDNEQYINDLFDDLLNRVLHSEIACENDVKLKEVVLLKIKRLLEKDKTAFHDPPTILGSSTFAQSVTTVNTQAGKIFNRLNEMLGTSGSIRRYSQKGSRPLSPDDKQPNVEQWEVLEGDETKTDKPQPSSEDSLASTAQGKDGTIVGKHEEARTELISKTEDKVSDNLAGKPEAMSDDSRDGSKEKAANEDDHSWSDFQSAETNTEQGTESDEPFEMETMELPSVSKYANYHRGYLRMRQKAFPKTKWPLLYFVVDVSAGLLLAQGKEQRDAVEFANLLLSSVKASDGLDVDRNFCFQLISPKAEHVLQALNEKEMNQWITAIQSATTEALKKSKEKLLSLTTSYDYGSNTKSEEPKKYVSNAPERVRNVTGNKRCVDCDHPRPDWASINLGVVMCIECSGVHRGLGVHISKVRSLTLDKWEEKVVKFMEENGNAKVNKSYEANLGDYKKPTRDSTKEERAQFIRLKYTDRKFIGSDVDVEAEMTCMEINDSDEEKLLSDNTEGDPKAGDSLNDHLQSFASSQLHVKDN